MEYCSSLAISPEALPMKYTTVQSQRQFKMHRLIWKDPCHIMAMRNWGGPEAADIDLSAAWNKATVRENLRSLWTWQYSNCICNICIAPLTIGFHSNAIAIFTQETQAPANRNARSKQWQPWLAACQRNRLRFLRFSFTQRTHRKRLRLNGNRASVRSVGVARSWCLGC